MAGTQTQNTLPETSTIPNAAGFPTRLLGKTGERVSILGLGGSHIGKVENEQESIRIMRSAIDRGLTFMDNSWDYNDGDSEIRMGKALADGYRDRVFLMTKFDGRTGKAAAEQFDESLRRLKVDHVDLLQFHEVIRLEDADRFFDEGGAAEALLGARRAGRTRYIGFTGHKDPYVHLRMLEAAAKHGFQFDTVQMPLNVMDAHFRSFERNVLPTLVKRGIGVLGMKSLGSGEIPRSGKATAIECLHYSLSLPVSTVITGIDSWETLEQAIQAALTFQPLGADEMDSLRERTKPAAENGKYERFKISQEFDSTAQHPQWLG